MVKFVILGQQRTGTSFIVTLLQSHPDILALGELFDKKEKLENGLVPTYELYLKETYPAGGPDHHSPGGAEPIRHYLDSVFAGSGYKAIGYKLMLGQIRRYPPVLDYLKENQFKILLVIRENILRTVISGWRARETGIYDSLQPDFSRGEHLAHKISVPVEVLLRKLEGVSAQNRELKATAAGLGLESLTVTYEGMSENRERESEKVLNFLGLEAQISLKTPLKKVSPPVLRDALANYDEIVQTLQGTPYAVYLDL